MTMHPSSRGLFRSALLGISLACVSFTASAQWSPGEGPLMTKWADEVSPDDVLPEYPRPQLVRERWKNLNGLWQCSPASEGDEPPIGRELEGEILVPFPVESALSGVMEHHDRLWYRRTFDVPEQWTGDRILLHFGAVDWETDVWVNGEHLGNHRGGYDAFTFDVTDALVDDGPQELVVGVWDPTDMGAQPRGKQVLEPGGIWYTPSTGIWQTVWLEPVSARSHLRELTIHPHVGDESVEIRGAFPSAGDATSLEIVILDGDRRVASATSGVAGGGGRGASRPAILLGIPAPRLWTPDDPHLYDVELTLRVDGEIVDRVESYFGMREVGLVKDESGVTRLGLNGEPVFMMGTLDQGFWPDGLYTAPTDDALRYDIEVTKKLGYNTIRKHVKVEPARWYYWCDTLGILVWQDMPNGDQHIRPSEDDIDRTDASAQQFERELVRMIEQHRNHPSIIMWVPFNEGWGQYDTVRITEIVRKTDAKRLIDNPSGWTDRGVGDVHDIHSYPGPASPEPEDDRAAVLGEFGGLGLPVKDHTWTTEAWGYRGMTDRDELMRRYEQLLRGVHELKDENGLAAAIYTQITDVETECNGLLTYDRAVLKVDPERLADANAGRLPTLVTVVECARQRPVQWRYTLQDPGEGWAAPSFNDSGWKRGQAGFGREDTPGAIVNTIWEGSDIWLRRTFELDSIPPDLRLLVHHDEDVEIYINGVRAAALEGYTTSYVDYPISAEGLAAIKRGENTIAVHCRQTRGGQYIDVGFVRLKPHPGD